MNKFKQYFISKKKFILYLTVLFFSLSFMTPRLEYDSTLERDRLAKYYGHIDSELFFAVEKYCKIYNLDMNEVLGLIKEESNFNPRATSVSYARGVMQIMPCHLRNGSPDDLYDIRLNVSLGTKYYAECLRMAGGDRKTALRYYNAGPALPVYRYNGWRYVNDILKHAERTRKIKKEYLVVRG